MLTSLQQLKSLAIFCISPPTSKISDSPNKVLLWRNSVVLPSQHVWRRSCCPSWQCRYFGCFQWGHDWLHTSSVSKPVDRKCEIRPVINYKLPLIRRPGVRFSKPPKRFRPISSSIMSYVSWKLSCFQARNFATNSPFLEIMVKDQLFRTSGSQF